MSAVQSKEEELKFTLFFKGSGSLTKKNGKNRFSPYKLVLFAQDLIVVNLAFGFVVWLTGLSPFLWESLTQSVCLFILSFMVIAFFPVYSLYSYHLIFFRKKHLVNLIKSVGWGLLTLCFIAALYAYPYSLEGGYVILFIFLAAIGVLLLSRFFWNHLLNVLESAGMSFLAFGIINFINAGEKPIIMEHWSAILIGFFLAFFMVLVCRRLLVHVVFNDWMRRHFRRQVAIIGSDQEAKRITSHIVEHNAPFWVAGFVSAQDVSNLEMPANKGRLGELKELPLIVEVEKIDEIIITDENIEKTTLISLLDYCISEGLTVWFPPKLMPIIDLKLHLDIFYGLPMIRLCSQKNGDIFNKIKHALDALIVLPAFLFILPFFLVIGIAIKLNSRGPVFYRARAVGKSGREFTIYKFRSMRVSNEGDIHKNYVSKFIEGEICYDGDEEKTFKITDDQRVTSIGKWLRKFSLDELPQVINVLKGEMSLVGPRPCLPYEYERYKDWHKKRLSIRPGITGVWQVAGRSAVTFEDMVLLDLYYIYKRSLLMDMSILYETIFAVMEKRGAY